MGFRKSAVKTLFLILLHKNSQIIFIDLILTVIEVFPDKAAVIPVFSNRGIAYHRFIFINRIKIKDKKPARIKIIIHQPEALRQLLFLQKII